MILQKCTIATLVWPLLEAMHTIRFLLYLAEKAVKQKKQ